MFFELYFWTQNVNFWCPHCFIKLLQLYTDFLFVTGREKVCSEISLFFTTRLNNKNILLSTFLCIMDKTLSIKIWHQIQAWYSICPTFPNFLREYQVFFAIFSPGAFSFSHIQLGHWYLPYNNKQRNTLPNNFNLEQDLSRTMIHAQAPTKALAWKVV